MLRQKGVEFLEGLHVLEYRDVVVSCDCSDMSMCCVR